MFGQFDYALTPDQTLRIGYNESRSKSSNLGIGAYDLPERAFSTENSTHFIRVQEAGPIGRCHQPDRCFPGCHAWAQTMSPQRSSAFVTSHAALELR